MNHQYIVYNIKTLIKNQLLKVMTVVGNIDEKQKIRQRRKQFKKQLFLPFFLFPYASNSAVFMVL